MLETAFPSKRVERVPERPSADFVKREEAEKAAAGKIAALRQARLDAEQGGALPALLYEVVRYRSHWRVLHNKHHSAPYKDQEAAIRAAIKTAKAKRKLGHPVEVRLNRTDGQVVPQPLEP